MIGDQSEMCAGYIEADVVGFFANRTHVSAQELSKTIGEWRQGFGDKKVAFEPAADTFPNHIT